MQYVTQDYGKSFDFYKQHAMNHVKQEIELKGTLDNFNTCLGEGIHQEVRECYKGTNGKNADPQVN